MPRSLFAALLALSLAVAPASSAQTIAIVGGTVYPVSSRPIERGTVLVRDGKIAAVGAGVAVPADAQRIDATGKIVTPGLVNAATSLGITEIGAVAATRNQSARGREGIGAESQSIRTGWTQSSADAARHGAAGQTARRVADFHLARYYIVDGHHHWAAAVAFDAQDNKLGDISMRVIRIDAPLTTIRL